jgi:hypothetical protein
MFVHHALDSSRASGEALRLDGRLAHLMVGVTLCVA